MPRLGALKDSGNTASYTPAYIVEAARRAMNGIDLDPASSAEANKTVKAARFYSVEDDGLAQPWAGNVWLNHPFGTKSNRLWIDKIDGEYSNIDQLVGICYAAVGTEWFTKLVTMASALWIPPTRIAYIDPRTGQPAPSPQKGSVVYGIKVWSMPFGNAFYPLGGKIAWLS